MKTRLALLALVLTAGCASTDTKAPERSPYQLQGHGAPTIVLQAGLGDTRDVWAGLVPALAREHRVLAVNRPGNGDAPAVNGPRDPCTLAGEQHAMMRRLGVKPPYVLVGHSLGGLYEYVFAKLYPEEVAGFVLLDPTHPRHWAVVQKTQPDGAAMIKVIRTVRFNATQRREFDDQIKCLDRLDMKTPLTQPGRVLISGRPQPMAGEAFERERLALGRDWGRLTGVAGVEMVWGSSHYIQREMPERVLAAIRAVISGKPTDTPARVDPQTLGLAGKPALTFTPGMTRQTEVEARWGSPRARLDHQSGEVWIYSEKLPEVPTLISFLPVVGDLVDAVDVVQSLGNPREIVLEFDAAGVLTHFRQREIE